MRSIPIDTNRVTLIGTGKLAARAKYAELADGSRKRVPDAQDTDDNGVPLWIIDCLVDDDDADRAEVIGVKVAAYEEPKVEKYQPVRFVGLVAVPYVGGNGRVAISMRAEGIEASKAHHDQKPAA